jgi:endonuclease/exonuclease/phosphatase family metal-dependent hydrolase
VGAADLRATAAVIRNMNADVVALQEVVPDRAALLREELMPDFPHQVYADGRGLVSRLPLIGPRSVRSSRGMNGFLFAEFEFQNQRIQIANVHFEPLQTWNWKGKLSLPWQLWRQPATHRAELSQVFASLLKGRPTILLGDFNRATDGAIELVRKMGFVDSFAEVRADANEVATVNYSFLGMRMGKRIDFVFHDSSFRTAGSEWVAGGPSDHDAITSVLLLNE